MKWLILSLVGMLFVMGCGEEQTFENASAVFDAFDKHKFTKCSEKEGQFQNAIDKGEEDAKKAGANSALSCNIDLGPVREGMRSAYVTIFTFNDSAKKKCRTHAICKLFESALDDFGNTIWTVRYLGNAMIVMPKNCCRSGSTSLRITMKGLGDVLLADALVADLKN